RGPVTDHRHVVGTVLDLYPGRVRVFEATLTSPETGPQCPRCGSFDLARTPRPAPGSEGACRRCAHRWHLDARCRPPRLLLEPDHFAREHGGEGDDT
ncbi:hypothetical protein ABZ927_36840, partial [Streptomyces massasporeus]